MWEAYRDDINYVYNKALGPGEHNLIQKGVTRAFAETFGLAYAAIDAVTGHQWEKEQRQKKPAPDLRNRVNENRYQLDKKREMPRKKAGQRKKKGRQQRGGKNRGRKKQPRKAVMQKSQKPRGFSRRVQRFGPAVSKVQTYTTGPQLAARYMSRMTPMGGCVISGKAFGGSIVQNWSGVLSATKEIEDVQEFTYDNLGIPSFHGFVFAPIGPSASATVNDTQDKASYIYGDTCLPVSPMLARYTPPILATQALVYRRYRFKKLLLAYRPLVPTSNGAVVRIAFTSDPTTLDVGHLDGGQLIWDDNLLNNMNPNVITAAYNPFVMDVTRYLIKKWFLIRGQQTYPNTPTSWNAAATADGGSGTFYQGIAPPVSVDDDDRKYAAHQSWYYTGRWDTADVRQTLAGIFAIRVDPDPLASESTIRLGDFTWHYEIEFADLNSRIGSNLGSQYLFIPPPTIASASTSALLSTSSSAVSSSRSTLRRPEDTATATSSAEAVPAEMLYARLTPEAEAEAQAEEEKEQSWE